MTPPEQFSQLLAEARRDSRAAQRRLYEQFYPLAMSVCIRYARDRREAEEICNDGFVRAFRHLGDLQNPGVFRAWLRQIMVRSAIDYHRKFHRLDPAADLAEVAADARFAVEPEAPERLSYEEKLALVQQLPPAQRLAFNLYAIEGRTTSEIAELLAVAEGTVRANVAKARLRLQEMLRTAEQIKFN